MTVWRNIGKKNYRVFPFHFHFDQTKKKQKENSKKKILKRKTFLLTEN